MALLTMSATLIFEVTPSTAVINQPDECAVALSQPLGKLANAALRCAEKAAFPQSVVDRTLCADKHIKKCKRAIAKLDQRVTQATQCTTESATAIDNPTICADTVAGAFAYFDAYTGWPLAVEPPSGGGAGLIASPRRCGVVYSKVYGSIYRQATQCAQNYAQKGVDRFTCALKGESKCADGINRMKSYGSLDCSPETKALVDAAANATCAAIRDQAFTDYDATTGNPAPENND